MEIYKETDQFENVAFTAWSDGYERLIDIDGSAIASPFGDSDIEVWRNGTTILVVSICPHDDSIALYRGDLELEEDDREFVLLTHQQEWDYQDDLLTDDDDSIYYVEERLIFEYLYQWFQGD